MDGMRLMQLKEGEEKETSRVWLGIILVGYDLSRGVYQVGLALFLSPLADANQHMTNRLDCSTQ